MIYINIVDRKGSLNVIYVFFSILLMAEYLAQILFVYVWRGTFLYLYICTYIFVLATVV